jgi:hypothetical protein
MANGSNHGGAKFVRPGADVSGSAILALVLGLFTLSWWVTALLTLALCWAVVDFIFRPWTARLRLIGRILLSVLAIGFIGSQMYQPMTDRFENAYHLGKYAIPPAVPHHVAAAPSKKNTPPPTQSSAQEPQIASPGGRTGNKRRHKSQAALPRSKATPQSNSPPRTDSANPTPMVSGNCSGNSVSGNGNTQVNKCD